jgi:hypothetical protein
MGSGLTTRCNSSRQSAGARRYQAQFSPQCPLSKIGAGAARHVLPRIGVVNLPVFLLVFRDQSAAAHEDGEFSVHPPCPQCPHLRHADWVPLCGNHGECAVRAGADAGPDIAKQVVGIVDPSAIGFQMNDFRRKLFSQAARRVPPVRFDTAGLSGLYPFATVGAHHRNGFPRRVLAWPVGPR